jgi:hypothetical protein
MVPDIECGDRRCNNVVNEDVLARAGGVLAYWRRAAGEAILDEAPDKTRRCSSRSVAGGDAQHHTIHAMLGAVGAQHGLTCCFGRAVEGRWL